MIYFFYGKDQTYVSITEQVFQSCYDGERVYITSDSTIRTSLFGDPLPGVDKDIVMFRPAAGTFSCDVFPNGTPVTVYQTLSTDEKAQFSAGVGQRPITTGLESSPIEERLELVHQQLRFAGGSLRDEWVEQSMAMKYLSPKSRVLEIGSNIGRNTLMIASILEDDRNLVTLECDPVSVELLRNNRFANNFRFHIEPSALSNRKLIQNGWLTTPSDELLPGYQWVNTITYDELVSKYGSDFDTLVADCEGALYYILVDNEGFLSNISTVILESDFLSAEHKQQVEATFRRYGLEKVYSEPLPSPPEGYFPDECVESFFETWKRDPAWSPDDGDRNSTGLSTEEILGLTQTYIRQILRLPAASPTTEPRIPDPVRPASGAPKPICFYLPQFHAIPENDAWWGEGFTEWTNVTRAVPQYIGHEQPKLPGALGFYDLSHVDAIRRQVELAKHYGIYGFCLYYYWFSGRRILEKPLDLLLSNPDIDFPFCICWANEDWTRDWDNNGEVLLQQDHKNEDPERFALDVAPILRDRRYIRVGDKPLLIIYRPPIIENFANRLEVWRDVFRREGVGEVAVYMVQGFNFYDPHPWACDGAIEFPPHNIGFHGNTSVTGEFTTADVNYTGTIVRAETVLQRARESQSLSNDYPWIRGCNPSWDNEARRPGRGWTMHGTTPEFFETWLRYVTGEGSPGTARNPDNYVFINAWNEWAEGAYLEPDRRYGHAMLNRIASVLQSPERANSA